MTRIDWTVANYCTECGRKMRKHHTRASDHPGTVEHNGHGRCRACAWRHSQTAKRGSRTIRRNLPRLDWSQPQQCTQCWRPMRRRQSRAADHPGTVPYGKTGMCTTCRDRQTRTGTVTPSSANHSALLTSYIADRRRRGIPEQGLPPKPWRYVVGVAHAEEGASRLDVQALAHARLSARLRRAGYDPDRARYATGTWTNSRYILALHVPPPDLNAA